MMTVGSKALFASISLIGCCAGGVSPASALNVFLVNANPNQPPTCNVVTVDQASANRPQLCLFITRNIGQYAIVHLAGPAAMGGQGYSCAINERQPNMPNGGPTLCVSPRQGN